MEKLRSWICECVYNLVILYYIHVWLDDRSGVVQPNLLKPLYYRGNQASSFTLALASFSVIYKKENFSSLKRVDTDRVMLETQNDIINLAMKIISCEAEKCSSKTTLR